MDRPGDQAYPAGNAGDDVMEAAADLILAYVEELERYLAPEGDRVGVLSRHELVDEVRAHLQDLAHGLELRGLPPDECARQAVARFGPPGVVASAWQRPPRRGDRLTALFGPFGPVVAAAGVFTWAGAIAGLVIAVGFLAMAYSWSPLALALFFAPVLLVSWQLRRLADMVEDYRERGEPPVDEYDDGPQGHAERMARLRRT